MNNSSYLEWLIGATRTRWWHDSAESAELELGLKRGAIGVTTNPYLANLALVKDRRLWAAEIDAVLARNLPQEEKAESLTRIAVTRTAENLMPEYERSQGRSGFVCAQVNPSRASDRERMLMMARRFREWSPNIAVKLPATAAGLDVMEEAVAEGITCAMTVSFTVPQVIAAAERHRRGIARAKTAKVAPGKCFSVIMIGRLDDFLRDVALDAQAPVSESDIRQAGLAVAKRAYSLYKKRAYEAVLLIAALRGDYHLTELAGADLLMSIAPAYQEIFVTRDLPREERIEKPVPADVIERLSAMPEFVRSYEPGGMTPSEFIGFGATQRTIGQFVESGWRLMESYH